MSEWHPNVAEFCKLVQDNPTLWLMDWQLKYLTVRIDTRDGAFVLQDRDGTVIKPDRVRAAADKARKLCGEPVQELPVGGSK